jgi:hypothetical protein
MHGLVKKMIVFTQEYCLWMYLKKAYDLLWGFDLRKTLPLVGWLFQVVYDYFICIQGFFQMLEKDSLWGHPSKHRRAALEALLCFEATPGCSQITNKEMLMLE